MALVAADPDRSASPVEVVFPTADGRFRFGGLRAGRYRIVTQAPGEAAEARWVKDPARMMELQIADGCADGVGTAGAQAGAAMKFWMALALAGILSAQEKTAQDKPKPGSIAGTVTQAGSGAPMRDVEIWVNRNSPQSPHAVTDQEGRFAIRDVPPGQIRVSANAPDPSGRTGFGPNSSRLVTLGPGQDLTGVDFKMVDPGTDQRQGAGSE